jgi:hypothetical protein
VRLFRLRPYCVMFSSIFEHRVLLTERSPLNRSLEFPLAQGEAAAYPVLEPSRSSRGQEHISIWIGPCQLSTIVDTCNMASRVASKRSCVEKKDAFLSLVQFFGKPT